MAWRTLEITFISAKDLPDVNVFSKMDVYAAASIDGDHRSSQRTPTDQDGGKSPSWNSVLRFSVPADPSAASRLTLHVVLRSERALGDRDVGDLRIPLKDLVADQGANAGKPQFVSYQVHKAGSGKPKGVLNISFKFLEPLNVQAPAKNSAPVSNPPPAGYPTSAPYPPPEKESKKKQDEPTPAYPPPEKDSKKHGEPYPAYPVAGASASAYPPPPAAAPYPAPAGYPAYPPQPYGYGAPPAPGYGYPPAPGYGYPPPPAGYGYGAPPVQPKKKKNNFGLGLGAGLLGGLVVGDLLADASSDAAYDSGYDAGFDDGGGFDF